MKKIKIENKKEMAEREEVMEKKEEKEKRMETIEEYRIEADSIDVAVKITGIGGKALKYNLFVPTPSQPTLALLDEIRHELVTEVGITAAEIFDPKIMEKLKEKFRARAEIILTKRLEKISRESKSFLIGTLMQEMLGLGKIEFILNDANLEEIVIPSSTENVRVYHKKYNWLETNIIIESEEQIQNYSNIIARRVGRQITTLSPLLDAHLMTGDRANAVFYPICTKGSTLIIRKFARDPWTIIDFIKSRTISSELAALIWEAMQYEMSILVAGGTAAGKTSLLNVMMPFIPPNQRIVTIEQTRELQLPKFLFWCPLVMRLPNPEGKGSVSMLDLLVNSLRMRPDRLILGEIRRKEEAEVLFEAVHTGHSVYATVHANSLAETIDRLKSPPISIPENLLGAVDLCVVMFRDRRKGIRRVYQTGEIIISDEGDRATARPNLLYRWKPVNDSIVPHAKSMKFFDELSRNTGMSIAEINSEIALKRQILDYMVKNSIRYVEDVGKIIADYYLDPEKILKIIKTNARSALKGGV